MVKLEGSILSDLLAARAGAGGPEVRGYIGWGVGADSPRHEGPGQSGETPRLFKTRPSPHCTGPADFSHPMLMASPPFPPN
ncbi:hypothetical protein NFI96_011334 [Prochilodus magdalenae]|nr:hypothetical protein NFI96_011334 [Prochilodus magdalenae]